MNLLNTCIHFIVYTEGQYEDIDVDVEIEEQDESRGEILVIISLKILIL